MLLFEWKIGTQQSGSLNLFEMPSFCDSKSIRMIGGNSNPVAETFIKSGLLVLVDGRLQLTAPIMRPWNRGQ